MCGLFGFVHYGNHEIKNLQDITNALAEESAVRGTDATGIAFNKNGQLNILKEAKSAYTIDFKHPDDVVSLIGHTRHSTHGSEKKNYNNHPFSGKCNNGNFALAHNGVLINDKDLKKKYKLPKSKIETDSYIAVQLIESKKELNAESIKFMAETVDGSFSFSILDANNTLWLVKGDGPLSILHFPNLELYVYASTEEILWKALVDTELFDELKGGNYEKVQITDGDILNILPDGNLVYDKFEYNESFGGYKWWNYGIVDENEYIKELKSVAKYHGYTEEDIDHLIECGFEPEEIEEYMYCY